MRQVCSGESVHQSSTGSAGSSGGGAGSLGAAPSSLTQVPVRSLKQVPAEHWYSLWHIAMHMSAGGWPQISGHEEPQSVQTWPPQSAP